jgi:hypothetical protein
MRNQCFERLAQTHVAKIRFIDNDPGVKGPPGQRVIMTARDKQLSFRERETFSASFHHPILSFEQFHCFLRKTHQTHLSETYLKVGLVGF